MRFELPYKYMYCIVPVDTCSDCPWEKFHSFLSQDHLESKIKLCMFHYSHAIRILHKRKTPVVWVCWASRDRGHNKTDAGGTPTPYPPLNCLKEVQCCLKCLLRAITIILIALFFFTLYVSSWPKNTTWWLFPLFWSAMMSTEKS